MSDYYQDGFNSGYGREYRGPDNGPQTDYDRYNYSRGQEDGERRSHIAEELDRECFGGESA